jgi:hypothetical protein
MKPATTASSADGALPDQALAFPMGATRTFGTRSGRVKGASEGLFISAKRYSLTRPDGSFVDYRESILGMLSPPLDGWIEEAWRTLSEMWDARPLTSRPWFDFPAVRPLAVTSPAYAREIKSLPGLRPWNFFLAATVGRTGAAHRRRDCPLRRRS